MQLKNNKNLKPKKKGEAVASPFFFGIATGKDANKCRHYTFPYYLSFLFFLTNFKL